jgi:DNA damage-binding protein 1
MWNYVVTANKPTAVNKSLVGNFTGPNDLNLIISKCTRIEIHLITPEGLQPMLDVGIYGRISAMELFRPKGEKQDLLFLLTERYKFCVLTYDAANGEIITRANGDVQDRIGRPAEIGHIGIVDPENRLIGMHLYDGMFKAIPIDEKGQLHEAFNIRIEELTVIDIKFLYGTAQPTIVVLYEDTKESRHIKTYQISLSQKEFLEGPWNLPNVEGGASMIITLPKPFGGTIVVGEQSIIYHNGTTFKSLAMKTTLMRAYGKIDKNGSRILFGDHMGKLYVLVLLNDGTNITDMKLELLGETSCASTISYLDNGVVFIGSTYGDSQLIKLQADKDPDTGQYFQVLESYTNLGPIVDFVVVDMDRQGQGQVVTCSGAFKDGSLRIVRNGIGINEHATVELSGIKGVWSIEPPKGGKYEKYLVVAFVGETRVLAMAGEELEETEVVGFVQDQQTLYCGNVVNNHFIQVTPKGVYLVDAIKQQLVDKWTPPKGSLINVSSCNTRQILVTTGGKRLHLLEIDNSKLRHVKDTEMPYEIACVNINPVAQEENPQIAQFCAVGLWTEISVRLLRLPSLEEVRKELLGGEIIPRSVLFTTFEGVHYLLVALGDGHVFTFTFDLATGALSNRKKVSLGTQPVVLSKFRSKGQIHVFACSDRPTVIYSHNKKLLYSNVNLKEVSYVSEFNSESFPDSLALATENSLTIGTIDDIQKLHIRTVPLGEMPRRIAHQESTHTFGVLTVKYHVDDNFEETETFYVKLFDDQTFEVLDRYKLEPFENCASILSCQFSEDNEYYYVVGTAFAYPNENEPTKGRILVFKVVDGKLNMVTSLEVRGAVYALVGFNGKLLAGINAKVQLFKWSSAQDGVRELTAECDHHGHILALYLATRGDFIVVGDLMRSISLLVYKPVGSIIEEIARDYNPNWMTAVEILDDDTYIGAENSYNIFTVRKNSEAATDEDRGRLEVVGEMHLGEFVNRFRHGSLVMKMPEAEGMNVPTLLFGTINGVIGVIASLPEDKFQFFWKLQQKISRVIKGVGGFIHEQWRAWSNERKTSPAKNFIDGDLIESFLDLSKEKMEEVAKGMEMSVEEVTKKIETLTQAIH